MEINKKVTMELVGLDGNAFSLMGAFQCQARKENWNPEEIDFVLKEFMRGDYYHLLATLCQYTTSPEDEDDYEEWDEDEY